MKITKQMKKDILEHKEYFDSRILDSSGVNYLNGFTAVGILNTPRKHLYDFNVILIYAVGYNGRGTKIVDNCDMEMTLDEAKDLMRCLNVVICRYEKIKIRRTK